MIEPDKFPSKLYHYTVECWGVYMTPVVAIQLLVGISSRPLRCLERDIRNHILRQVIRDIGLAGYKIVRRGIVARLKR